MIDGIYNAQVTGTKLWFEDHGCLCLDLYLVHEWGHQAFGCINLFNLATKKFENKGGNVAGWYIKRVFEICGVDNYDDLIGKTLRVKIEDGIIRSIGHIINNDWFSPAVDFNKENGE